MLHERTQHGNIQVVHIREKELGFDVSQKFKDMLRKYVETYAGPMIVCMDEVEFVDSTALSALVATERRLLQAGYAFCLCGVNGPVFRIIKLTALDSHLHIEPTLDKALASLSPA